MTLLALAGIPCFTLLIGTLVDAWGVRRRSASTLRARAVQFLKGAALALPAVLLMLLLRRIVPVSYRPLALYLHGTAIDHFLPAALLVAGTLLWLPSAGYDDLTHFYGGFYSLVSLVMTIAGHGHYDLHLLFLLPVLRMATLVLLPLAALRFSEAIGWFRVLHGAALAAIPLAAGAVSYLHARFFTVAAIVSTVVFLAGALLACYLDRR